MKRTLKDKKRTLKDKIAEGMVWTSFAGGTLGGTIAGHYIGRYVLERVNQNDPIELILGIAIYGMSIYYGVGGGIYLGIGIPWYIAKGLDKRREHDYNKKYRTANSDKKGIKRNLANYF